MNLMNKKTVDFEGRPVKVHFQKLRGELWFHINGETYSYQPQTGRRASAGAKASANPGEVVAPMPGKIIKIFVEPGQKVSRGEVLVVMEAMKMEYTLKAESDGEVEAVSVEVDKQVDLGEVLVNLKVE